MLRKLLIMVGREVAEGPRPGERGWDLVAGPRSLAVVGVTGAEGCPTTARDRDCR